MSSSSCVHPIHLHLHFRFLVLAANEHILLFRDMSTGDRHLYKNIYDCYCILDQHKTNALDNTVPQVLDHFIKGQCPTGCLSPFSHSYFGSTEAALTGGCYKPQCDLVVETKWVLFKSIWGGKQASWLVSYTYWYHNVFSEDGAIPLPPYNKKT